MTNLQLSLLAAGGVVIIGVFGYNKWQEWRHRKVAQAVFAEETPDILMGQQTEVEEPGQVSGHDPLPGDTDFEADPQEFAERKEPSLQPLEPAADMRVEPVLHPESPLEEAPVLMEANPEVNPAEAPGIPAEILVDRDTVPLSPEVRKTLLIPVIPRLLANTDCDAILALELVQPKGAPEILRTLQPMLGKITKPVFWLGLGTEGTWVALTTDTPGSFLHLRLVVQLADRRGPMTEQDVHAVHQAAQSIAVEWNAVLDEGDLETALLRARQLDQFCVEVDLQIGINLLGPVPFAGTKIRALAEAAGMALNLQGAFEKQDENGNVLFSLSNQEANPFAVETLRTLKTHGLTFLLDVPRVAETGFVFDHMLRLAKQFSEALQARIVDDNRRPLTEAQLANIREQFVVKSQQDMATRKIPAGSSLALRLFS